MSWLHWLSHWRVRRVLKRHPIDHRLWLEVVHQLPLLQQLDAVERAYLRELTTLFLQQKSFSAAHGLLITERMKVVVAAQACLLVLHLGLDYYRGWVEIVLYPGAFRVHRDQQDSDGVSHDQASALSGEAWLRGPVILSWQDVERDSQHYHAGHHVVLHEFAHKLDGLNGAANGMPPLRRHMSHTRWTQVLSESYQHLCRSVELGLASDIPAYGATNPAEFFAVVTECFYTAPHRLQQSHPALYEQFCLFYQQRAL
ncbi:hypothetical protein WH50_25150 [Pokkaliibacter plantistimulans]|uniref:Protein MtfA n=1 Tax=Pokkaliibacter plantistimulans TaxID=1635171 RepID=A0ABX5LTP6_9GAMM|nr:M90 family metallopeptidase [Pokkaliibacter plantistimulans]PXF28656.1 hypothetical protein WH50_25150 [Pokkaliibacter plantistimulans]